MLETTQYEPISVFLTEYSTDAQTLRTFTTTPFNTSDNGIPRGSNVTCPEARLVISRCTFIWEQCFRWVRSEEQALSYFEAKLYVENNCHYSYSSTVFIVVNLKL